MRKRDGKSERVRGREGEERRWSTKGVSERERGTGKSKNEVEIYDLVWA